MEKNYQPENFTLLDFKEFNSNPPKSSFLFTDLFNRDLWHFDFEKGSEMTIDQLRSELEISLETAQIIKPIIEQYYDFWKQEKIFPQSQIDIALKALGKDQGKYSELALSNPNFYSGILSVRGSYEDLSNIITE
jgi:hypothetical protein